MPPKRRSRRFLSKEKRPHSPRDETTLKLNGNILATEALNEIQPPIYRSPEVPFHQNKISVEPIKVDPPVEKIKRNKKTKTSPKKKKTKRKTVKPLRIPDFEQMKEKDRLGYLHHYKSKLSAIADNFPNIGIPTFKEINQPTVENLVHIHEIYDKYTTHVMVNNRAGIFSLVLVIFFAGTEYVLTTLMGLPGSGFVSTQIKNIASYKLILYEIAEEFQRSSGGKSSPWWNLIYLMGTNLLITLVLGVFQSKLGYNLQSMMGDTVQQLIHGVLNNDPQTGSNLSSLVGLVGGILGKNSNPVAPTEKKTDANQPPYSD